MATRDWLDQSADWNDVANWTGGAVPVNGDLIRLLVGSKTITTNLDQSAVDPAGLVVGSNFRCVVGAPGTPLKLGTVGYVHYAAADCSSFNFWPDDCASMVVQAAGASPYALLLEDGVVTQMIVKSGRGVVIGAGAQVDSLILSADAGVQDRDVAVSVNPGATMDEVYVDGGTLFTQAAVPVGRLWRGRWDHLGTSVDVDELLMTGGEFILRGPDCDVPDLEVVAGLFDASREGSPKSIGGTRFVLWPRATLNANNGARTITLGTITPIGTINVILEPGRTVTVSA
jgi:hypothetical protein